MRVTIKDLGIPMEIKSRGIEIDVSDNSGHLGDLYVTMSNLIWCKGKTFRANGTKMTWGEFMRIMEDPKKTRRLLKKL